MAKIEELSNAIINGKRDDVVRIVQEQVDQQADVEDILMNSMIPAMRTIGERFSRNEVYVPQMLVSARAMQGGLDIIEPLLADTGHKPVAKVAIGTVKGDLHDIGKNLVAMMVKGAGYEVDDLGVDCDTDKFDAAVADGAQAVMLSALLTTTMPYMKEIVEHFKAKEDCPKIVIGGAPVTQKYADEIGADAYSPDASKAVDALEMIFA